MKKVFLFILIGSILLLSINSFAFTINFATGQDTNGQIQTTGNSLDTNWTATNQQTGATVPTYVTTSSNADWYSNWGNIVSSDSSWIAPYPNQTNNGYYTYVYTFDLTGYELATAMFSGMKFAIDDEGSAYLNGNWLGSQSIGGGNYYFTDLTVLSSYLVNGTNTLTVVSGSTDNYLEAMRFEGKLEASAVPIPGTLLLFGPGLAGLAMIRRRFTK